MQLGNLQKRIGLLAALGVAMVWGFQKMLFDHAPNAFRSPAEDMSFAWYVPLFSLYVVWTERQKLKESLGRPSFLGLLLTLPFLALGFLGTRGIQLRLEIVAFVGLLITLPWAFFGRKTAQQVLFPAAFLLFCIPLATFLDVITVHLRLFATATAEVVLNGCGAEVVRVGSMLGAADGSFKIDVAEPCSGLRSIFALMALSAGYGYFSQPTWLRRGLLFASSVPLAILGNVTRILTICLVANYASKDFAMGFYHDYSGYIVFVVAISLMVVTGELIKRAWEKWGTGAPVRVSDSDPISHSSDREPKPSRTLLVPALAFLLVVPAMVFQAQTPNVTLAEAPRVVLCDVEGYQRTEIGPTEAELQVLPKDTQITKGHYAADNGDWFLASVVIGGVSKSSIHRPELCLPSQGFQMTSPRTVTVNGIDWRFITLVKDTQTQGFAYTFFNQEGFHTASHVRRILRDVWDRSVLNRIDRWVMVTVHAGRADDASMTEVVKALEGVCK